MRQYNLFAGTPHQYTTQIHQQPLPWQHEKGEGNEMELLVIGIHTRPAVFSAKRLGYRVFSVDYFGDQDTKDVADASLSIVNQMPYRSNGRISENYSDEKLIALAKALAKRFQADKTILTSTLTSGLTSISHIRNTLCGTSPERMREIKDKEYQLKKVEKLGIRIPKSEFVDSREEAIEAAGNIGLPCILKPARGDGGNDVRRIGNLSEIQHIQINERYLVQEFVKGRAVSVSTLSTKTESKGISTSTQILGSRLLNQEGFVYCGSIVPWKNDDVLLSIAEKISKKFKVLGWNGIDFVAGRDGDYTFMELNPRFQGTFDCIERVYGINLIDAHIRACEGELIDVNPPAGTAVRLTLYAKKRLEIVKDLRNVSYDVPVTHSIIEDGEPITTVITHEATGSAAIRAAKMITADIYASFVRKCV